MTSNDALIADFLTFLDASPTPFHAVASLVELLAANDFTALDETAHWDLQAGGRYYVVRNGSSLIAFIYGQQEPCAAGLRLVGAHTDSPCLKIKPQPELREHDYLRLGVEVYGGALLNPWFDRDLSIAGRVSVSTESGIDHALVDFRDPVAVIPSLAIHLDREQNSSRNVNSQQQLPPLLALSTSEQREFRTLLLDQLRTQSPQFEATQVLDFDLCLYDTQPPARTGLHGEFIAGARLDNLLSCFVGVRAMLAATGEASALLVCNDHEEVGSRSAVGAQGPMLSSFLQRLIPDAQERERALMRSMLISVDNAHGIHPNFADRHDAQHGPMLNSGPVIKANASQRYATNSETAAVFRWLCEATEVPVQSFVMRSDLACGSTIGPITAAELGVRTLDVGVPTFAMHSIRELAGSLDIGYLLQVLTRFAGLPHLPV